MSSVDEPPYWATIAFAALFIFRYLRLIVHVVGYVFYRAATVPRTSEAFYHPSDVTAVMATVDPTGSDFEATLTSVLLAGCSEVIVVTIDSMLAQANKICSSRGSRVKVYSSSRTNKRVQMCIGLRHVRTKLVLFVDDHVWFEDPPAFLRSVISPFEDDRIGGVAVGKRVTRLSGKDLFSSRDMLNFIACLYLERHNFDLAASNTIDGGVFVISGRTSVYRSSIVCSDDFIHHFLDEFWFFRIGPLHADDDNCLTRWLVDNDWKIKFQHSRDAIMYTSLGVDGFKKYNSQCLRWARTTWRSNSTSLFRDRTVWRAQPWCAYAVHLSSFFNFALFVDSGLIILGKISLRERDTNGNLGSVVLLLTWVCGSKLIKQMPHLTRHPRDILYFPIYILFAYYHSLLKFWALITVNSLSWGSRPDVVS